MRKNSFGENVIAFLVVIGIFVFIGMIGEASEPKCIKSGCDNKQASGSSYCHRHKSAGSRSSYSGSSSYGGKTSGSYKNNTGNTNSYTNNSGTTSSSYSNSTKKNTTTKKNTYDSYDDGYDDIYMDGDYDYDRYESDSDYADGVDDAMDEFGEDW